MSPLNMLQCSQASNVLCPDEPATAAGTSATAKPCAVCWQMTYCTATHISILVQDFLNGVCTHVIWLTKQKLTYYTGNYDTFVKTVRENEVIQQKKYEKEQDDIKHLKAFIASCGELAFMHSD